MKKVIASILSFLLLFSVSVQATTYYDYKEVEVLGEGITRTHIRRFCTNGWQNINIVAADLSVSHVKAELLTDTRGSSYLTNVLKMAQDADSIAAVNSDFFARSGFSSSRGTALGVMVEDNQLVSSSNHESGFASLAVTNDGNIILDYLTTDITITAPDGESRKVKHINKYDPLDQIVIYTRDFDTMSGGSKDNVLEVVVENNVITKMLQDQDPVEIPENGYVIRHLPEFDSFLLDHFKVGDTVQLDVQTNFDLNQFATVAGGGTLLVKDGQKAEITHNVYGVNPRTAAGTDQSGKILYLVTVDGRQSDAVGMTMSELQDLLIEQGIYHAINFDGGGSTTLVTRDLETGEQNLSNVPSDGGMRPVPVGLQIKSTAPKGELGGFIIGCDDSNVFSGMSRKFYVKSAYDIYHNSYDGEIPQVTWEIDPNYGHFEGNILKTTSAGQNITVTASYGDAKGTMEIDIIEPPTKLEASPSHFYISQLDQPEFLLRGTNAQGYTALIEEPDYTITQNQVTEVGYREVWAAGQKTYLTFTGPDSDTFEGSNGSAAAIPSNTVSANYVISTEQAKSGYQSGKLFFDFLNPDPQTKAAYVVFHEPKPVIPGTKQIGVWVYSQYPCHQWLRAEFTDQNGEIQRVTLTEDIDFTGWKFLTAPIDDSFAQLTKLYVVQNNYQLHNSGYLMFDNLTFIQQEEPVTLPSDYSSVEPVESTKQEADYTFTVMGGFPTANTLLSNLFRVRTTFAINELSPNVAWFIGNAPETVTSNIRTEVKTVQGYESFLYDGGRYIVLNNANDGVSNTDRQQWEYLSSDLKGDYENLFLFLPVNMDLTSDKEEVQVLKDMLYDAAETKNVYVFYNDKADAYYQDQGVHFVALAGIYAPNASLARHDLQKYMYAKISIKDRVPVLTFEKIY